VRPASQVEKAWRWCRRNARKLRQLDCCWRWLYLGQIADCSLSESIRERQRAESNAVLEAKATLARRERHPAEPRSIVRARINWRNRVFEEGDVARVEELLSG